MPFLEPATYSFRLRECDSYCGVLKFNDNTIRIIIMPSGFASGFTVCFFLYKYDFTN